MHQENEVQHCFETQMKYVRSPAGWKGKEGLQEYTQQEKPQI